MEGKKTVPHDKAFSVWCQNNGFGSMDPAERSNALWLAREWDEVWATLGSSQPNLANPTGLRKAYRKAKRAVETGVPAVPTFNSDDAAYALKLAAVAERGGSETEREVAKEKLEAFAGTFGMTAEEAVGAGEEMQPKELSPFDVMDVLEASMARRAQIAAEVRERFKEASRDDLLAFIADMKARGLLLEE